MARKPITVVNRVCATLRRLFAFLTVNELTLTAPRPRRHCAGSTAPILGVAFPSRAGVLFPQRRNLSKSSPAGVLSQLALTAIFSRKETPQWQ